MPNNFSAQGLLGKGQDGSVCKTISGVTYALTDTPCETPTSALASSAAVEALVIGPFGIECLGVGVYVQFKKIFGHILICIFGLFGFLSWLFLI